MGSATGVVKGANAGYASGPGTLVSGVNFLLVADMRGSMSTFAKVLEGYQLTTAEILYHRPDYPALLQSYVWQEYDLLPKFPALNRFLHFWEAKLDALEVYLAELQAKEMPRLRSATGESEE